MPSVDIPDVGIQNPTPTEYTPRIRLLKTCALGMVYYLLVRFFGSYFMIYFQIYSCLLINVIYIAYNIALMLYVLSYCITSLWIDATAGLCRTTLSIMLLLLYYISLN